MSDAVLKEAQARSGAHFDENGVPLDYGDWRQEYNAACRSAGLLAMPHLGCLAVYGKDAISFLHNLLSNDLRPLSTGAPCVHTCALDSTGHILADLAVTAISDHLLLEIQRTELSKILDYLNSFLIAEDV